MHESQQPQRYKKNPHVLLLCTANYYHVLSDKEQM